MKKTILIMLALGWMLNFYMVSAFQEASQIAPFAYFEIGEGIGRLEGQELVIEAGQKSIALDLGSFAAYGWVSEENKPDLVKAEHEEGRLILSFLKGSRTLYAIEQEGQGRTIVFFGVPGNLLEKEVPLVYFVEHYDPDARLDDPGRQSGALRPTIISKNSPEVIIYNKGLSYVPGRFLLSRESFLSSKQDSEIDEIMKSGAIEVFTKMRQLFFIVSESIFYDRSFDRGFYLSGKVVGGMQNLSYEKNYIDVIKGSCSKIGFVFLPGGGYPLEGVNAFTKNTGFALTEAYAAQGSYDTSLGQILSFVEKTDQLSLTPIIRLMGEKRYAGMPPPEDAARFIKKLRQETGNKVSIFQIGDKPNLEYEGIQEFKSPEEYADYFSRLRGLLEDEDIKLVSASLAKGESMTGAIIRESPKDYLLSLAENTQFLDALGYFGSSSYSMNLTGNECINGTELYPGEELCIDSAYGYKWELETIYSKSSRLYPVILTETGGILSDENKLRIMGVIHKARKDTNLAAVLLFAARGMEVWQSTSWIEDQSSALTPVAGEISDAICSSLSP